MEQISSISTEMWVVCWFNSGAFSCFVVMVKCLWNSSHPVASLIKVRCCGLDPHNGNSRLACVTVTHVMFMWFDVWSRKRGDWKAIESRSTLCVNNRWTGCDLCMMSPMTEIVSWEMPPSRHTPCGSSTLLVLTRRGSDRCFGFLQSKLAQFQLKPEWSAGSIPVHFMFCNQCWLSC